MRLVNRRVNLKLFSAALICTTLCLNTDAQTGTVKLSSNSKDAIVGEIDSYLKGLEGTGFSGAVLLAQDGEVLLKRGYGLAGRAGKRPVTSETGFDIGSLVKPFTAVAIFKLETQGKLKVDDPISKFFKNAPPDKASITVQQLLAHTSGLPDIINKNSDPVEYQIEFDYEAVTREEIVRRALGAKLRSIPGEKSQYSNLGYSLLGAIIEIASGQPYEEYVYEQIYKPAGMKRTGYLIPRWTKQGLAVGYKNDKPWGTPLDHKWMPDGPSWNLRANGGMLSTVDDLYKWLKALEGEAILTGEAKRKFFAASVHKNRRGARTIGAAGGNDIFNAVYLWYVDEDRILILMTNVDKFRAENIVPELAKKMLSLPATSK